MIGMNELTINQATMCAALEHWLVTRVLDPNTVIEVDQVIFNQIQGTFTIRVKQPEKGTIVSYKK